MQETTTDLLIFNIDNIVSYTSRYITLEPGDVIFTGTPGTTQAMKPGDTFEVEVVGVTTLRNKVVAVKGRRHVVGTAIAHETSARRCRRLLHHEPDGARRPQRAPIESITQADLRADLFFLAGDAMRGRLTDTNENRVTVDYIRSRFERAGLKPAAATAATSTTTT